MNGVYLVLESHSSYIHTFTHQKLHKDTKLQRYGQNNSKKWTGVNIERTCDLYITESLRDFISNFHWILINDQNWICTKKQIRTDEELQEKK